MKLAMDLMSRTAVLHVPSVPMDRFLLQAPSLIFI